jgi:transcriptional regulator with GAF, ATPase, and Fis domain
MDHAFLLTLRWPGHTRSFAVGRAVVLSSRPGTRTWTPWEVLDTVDEAAPELAIDIAEGPAGPEMFIDGEPCGPRWASGDLEVAVQRLPDELRSVDDRGLIEGDSIAMRRLVNELRLASRSTAPVLIHGETGTGKERIARTLHDWSPRAGKPYVVIDCAAISETLLESELFGHARGSFSGATNNRVGPFEEADGGTVLIDEVGDIPLSLQPKLLRVLESGTVRRVGENTYRNVDVRVVSATHRDLRAMVDAGTFRSDLYYRLAVLEVRPPPLRERFGDLPTLLRSLLRADVFDQLTTAQWDAVELHMWKGNVRELRNFAQKALTHGWGSLFREQPTPPSSASMEGAPLADPPAPPPPPRSSSPTHGEPSPAETRATPLADESLAAFRARWNHEGEAVYLATVLKAAGGSVTRAARVAGVDRSHLHRLLRRHNLGARDR